MNPFRLIFFLTLTSLAGGCSVINVYSNGVKVSRYVGLPVYSLEPNEGAIYFDIKGLGLITSPSGASIGYIQQVYAQVPQGSCSIVIFTTNQTQSDELASYLQKANIDPAKICLTHQGS